MGFLFDKIQFLVFVVFLFLALGFDSQLFFSEEYYHDTLVHYKKQYVKDFKDPLYTKDAPQWVKSIFAFTLIIGVPYYLIAIIAYAKGNCACIRTPTLIGSTMWVTSLVPILVHIWNLPLEGPGLHPTTNEEFYKLFGFYFALFFYNLFLIIYFLRNPNYGLNTPVAVPTHSAKKAKKN